MIAVAEKKAAENPHLGNRDEFIEENIKLVYLVAGKMRAAAEKQGFEFDDLVQVGSMGLLKAYEKYNPELFNVKFSTYAVPTIKGSILRYLRDNPIGLRYPRPVRQLAIKIVREELEERGAEEISKVLDVEISQVEEARWYLVNKQVKSLNEVVFESDGKPISMFEQIGNNDDCTGLLVRDFIHSLSGREQRIVEWIMQNYSQTEIGKKIGVSQVQVSRLIHGIRSKFIEYFYGESSMPDMKSTARSKTRKRKTNGPRVVDEEKVTKENYLKLHAQGLTDNTIAKKHFGMKNVGHLKHYLIKWGLREIV